MIDMLTGELRNKVDRLWDTFWSGGISNPLEVIEQITYLLFLKRLDDLHTLEGPPIQVSGPADKMETEKAAAGGFSDGEIAGKPNFELAFPHALTALGAE